MSLSWPSVLAIILMALTTYLTRIGGYLLLGRRAASPRMGAVMEAAPGCVLLSVIAPHFSSGRPADLLALAIAAISAANLSLLHTVVITIAATGILRTLL